MGLMMDKLTIQNILSKPFKLTPDNFAALNKSANTAAQSFKDLQDAVSSLAYTMQTAMGQAILNELSAKKPLKLEEPQDITTEDFE